MAYPEGKPFEFFHSSDTEIVSSGKTSLIHSLAGELGLDIYVVSLSSKGSVASERPMFFTESLL